MKPVWHTGPWSKAQTQELIAELKLAEHTRSLTNEEQLWLKAAHNAHNNPLNLNTYLIPK